MWSVAVYWVHKLWGFLGGAMGGFPNCVLPRAILHEL